MKTGSGNTTKVTLIVLFTWLVFAQSCMRFRISDRKAIANFKKAGVPLQSYTQNINGHNLHYVCTGSDSLPVLIFIHGSPGSWNAFEDYLKDSALLQHFYMVSIDRPGFGYSDYGNAQHLKVQSQIISRLLHQLKSDKPMYLAGHSLGGPLIVKLAYDNPGLINALVMLAASVDPKQEKKESWRKVLAFSPLRYAIPGAMRPCNDELMYFKKDVLEMPAILPKIVCRVFIIQGDHDSLVPYENALYAKSTLVNAKPVQLITLRGADHFIPWTNYADIKKVLLRLDR